MGRKSTKEEFLEKCKNIFDDMNDYELLSPYINNNTKIKFLHKPCNSIRETIPTNFLNGYKCVVCSKNEFIKNMEIKQKILIDNLTSGEYELLEYFEKNKKSIFRHKICGNVFNILIGNFVSGGQRCPECGKFLPGFKIKKTNDEFLNQLYELKGHEYIPQEEYKNIRKKIKILHSPCGNIFELTPGDLLNNASNHCPFCPKFYEHGIPPSENNNFESAHPELLVFWDYNKNLETPNNFTPSSGKLVWWICKNNHSFKKRINIMVYRSISCPLCPSLKSLGESKVKEILEKYSIFFIPEKIFNDCKSHKNGNLKFDFYLSKYNILIEYDGIQHFQPVDFGHREKEKAQIEFDKLKIRDSIKTEYCIKNNIGLIRIPYWEFDNIEKILLDKIPIMEGG